MAECKFALYFTNVIIQVIVVSLSCRLEDLVLFLK